MDCIHYFDHREMNLIKTEPHFFMKAEVVLFRSQIMTFGLLIKQNEL